MLSFYLCKQDYKNAAYLGHKVLSFCTVGFIDLCVFGIMLFTYMIRISLKFIDTFTVEMLMRQ